MAAPAPKRAGPLWLWLLGLVLLLVAVWILVDQLTDEELRGGAGAPPAAEVEPQDGVEPRRDALRIRPDDPCAPRLSGDLTIGGMPI